MHGKKTGLIFTGWTFSLLVWSCIEEGAARGGGGGGRVESTLLRPSLPFLAAGIKQNGLVARRRRSRNRFRIPGKRK